MNRRGLLRSILAVGMAPVVVKAGILMPAKKIWMFFCRSPSAITRTVVAVRIFAIQRLSGRPFAHVGEEVLENFPSGVNPYSPATIPLVLRGVGIRAALAHLFPAAVCGRTGLRVAVLVVRLAFLLFASARFCQPIAQLQGIDMSHTTAGAATLPDDPSVAGFLASAYDGEAAKGLPDEIDHRGMMPVYRLVVNDS